MQPASNMGIRFRTHFKPFGPSKKREKGWARGEILRIEKQIRKKEVEPEGFVGTLKMLYGKITEINRRHKDCKRK